VFVVGRRQNTRQAFVTVFYEEFIFQMNKKQLQIPAGAP